MKEFPIYWVAEETNNIERLIAGPFTDWAEAQNKADEWGACHGYRFTVVRSKILCDRYSE